tara:strand:+ start:13014 stop:13769 length:756 start_codon:yes stop_codon:yes gene_type:complete
MKINIIMSVFNSISTLEDCLNSIYSQSHEDWHMYLIDDASNDGSEILISNIMDSRVTILRNKINKGLAFSLNKAIKLCKESFIARIDSDDIQDKDRLINQVEYLIKNPKIDLLCTDAYLKDLNGFKRTYTPNNHNEISKILQKRNCIVHPTVMVKRSFFKKYGLYDESFRRAQDYELWLRALRKGAKFGCLNKPLIYYNSSYSKWNWKTLFRHSYNRFRIFLKYQNIYYLNYFLIDIFHPYILRLISLFKR